MTHTVHTPGRMIFEEEGDANRYRMMDEHGRWWLALLHNGEAVSVRQAANMRRLAAAWNACDGIETATLEEIANSGGVTEVVHSAARHAQTLARMPLALQRDALAAALRRYLDSDPTAQALGDTPAHQARKALRMLVAG